MKSLLLGVVACVCVSTAAAADPTGAQLRADGDQLARDGRFTEAIAAFKAAHKLEPRATDFCLIGLAYARRELWSQAEIMIDRCKQLASASDPLPEWLPALEATLGDRLVKVDVAPIELFIDPAGVDADLTISSFSPDESFHARPIHLPFGVHHVVATAAGFDKTDQVIEVTDRQPQRIVVHLHPIGVAPPPPPPPPPPAPPPPPKPVAPLVAIGTGAALLVTGAIYHATAFRTAANHLADATSPTEYDAWSHRFDVRREAVVGFYAAGAIALGVGLAWRLLGGPHAERDTHVGVAPTRDGAVVTFGWSR